MERNKFEESDKKRRYEYEDVEFKVITSVVMNSPIFWEIKPVKMG
jgi:hypothetical protein